MKQPAVYILANKKNGTIYTGVTSSLATRIYQHRNGVSGGFAMKYGAKNLVWYQLHETMEFAILREKALKAGSRAAKVALIAATKPDWLDLYGEL